MGVAVLKDYPQLDQVREDMLRLIDEEE